MMRRHVGAGPARSLRARAAAALDAMSERDRLVLALRLLEGLSPLESAGALRLPERDVEQRTARSFASLAEELRLPRSPGRAA